MNLVIDIGNSRVKIALFQDGEMLKHSSWETGESFDMEGFLDGVEPDGVALSSVRNELPSSIEEAAHLIGEPLVLSSDTPLSIEIAPTDPSSLGNDRLANAVGAYVSWPERDVLVIDMGTCITYDLVAKGTLLGGAISPGVRMRAEAMERSTARLPRVELEGRPERIEEDTLASLRSGIYYGVLDEIKGRIEAFLADHPNGAVVLTGGDASLVGKEFKKGIFADPFLTLRGLDAVLHEHIEGGLHSGGPGASS